jgi:WD40 repeat protein
MILMAGVGLLIWLFTWAKDLDEKVVLSLWAVGIAAALVCCRLRLRWGLRICCALATVCPAIGYLPCGVLAGMTGRYTYLLVGVAWIGLASGIATVVVIVSYWLIDWINQKAGWRCQMVSIAGLIALCAGAIIGGKILLHTDNSWRPEQIISNWELDPRQEPFMPISVSGNGKVLAVAEPAIRDAQNQTEGWLQIWKLRAIGTKPLQIRTPLTKSLCLSPGGEQIAVVHAGAISVYDASSGTLTKVLPVPTANLWVHDPCCFSPDGQSFLFCTSDYESQKAFLWSTKDWTLQLEQNVRQIAMPAIHKEKLVLVTFTPGGSGGEIALRDLRTLQPLFDPVNVSQIYLPVPCLDGLCVAYGNCLLDWKTSEVATLPASVYTIVNGGRSFVSRRSDLTEFRSEPWPDWRYAVPFARQWCRFNDSGQAVLFDIATGNEVCSSPNYEREGFWSFEASADGSTVVGATWSAKLYVWRMPDESEGNRIVNRVP